MKNAAGISVLSLDGNSGCIVDDLLQILLFSNHCRFSGSRFLGSKFSESRFLGSKFSGSRFLGSKANQAGENSSFIFTVCVKSVPCYHFKLAYVVLQMAVKEFFETHF